MKMTKYFCDICGKEMEIDFTVFPSLKVLTEGEFRKEFGAINEICTQCESQIVELLEKLKSKTQTKEGFNHEANGH